MKKEFISYNQIRNDAIKLADRICKDGFLPDVIYVSLRGGAYLGNIISEYFKIAKKDSARPVFFAAVVAHSYSGIREQERIRVDGWTYSPEYLRTGDKVLLIDDIYDTGLTLNHLTEIILAKGLPRADVKIAVYDYKINNYKKEKLPIVPDYWCRQHILNDQSDEVWFHYMSHELDGLSEAELEAQYYPDEPSLRPILTPLLNPPHC